MADNLKQKRKITGTTAYTQGLEALVHDDAHEAIQRSLGYFDFPGYARTDLADLCRDIVHNPFQSVLPEYHWQGDLATRRLQAALNYNKGAVWNMANIIYNEHDFTALPILADLIEDTTGGDDEVTRHLRSPGPHVRGCWALDLLLGKS
jgi:hypothetical protein